MTDHADKTAYTSPAPRMTVRVVLAWTIYRWLVLWAIWRDQKDVQWYAEVEKGARAKQAQCMQKVADGKIALAKADRVLGGGR